jgi:hypothetical protein
MSEHPTIDNSVIDSFTVIKGFATMFVAHCEKNEVFRVKLSKVGL